MNVLQFLTAAHNSIANCDEMAVDRLRQLRYKFSALNVYFSSLRCNSLSSRKPAHAGVKEGYSLKSGSFTVIGSCSVKTVTNRYRHVAYITSAGDGLFRFININNLEQF